MDRPRFHIRPRAGWLNDPNGVIRWAERYHVFYQHNPASAEWGDIHWGHVSSADLVHWRHEPIALAPDPGGPDGDGCWSGSAVDDAGVPTVLYTGRSGTNEAVCLATGDADLRAWTKAPDGPVLLPPDAPVLSDFRDPKVWKESDGWHMVIGAGLRDGPGAVLHYRSPDLHHWTQAGPVLVGGPETRGQVWECPDLFAVDGRWVLLTSVTPGSESTRYAVGTWDGSTLSVERTGSVDLGPYVYAAQTHPDGEAGRLFWGWIREGRSVACQVEAGWSGAMALPRRTAIGVDGDLVLVPARELDQLRGRQTSVADHLLARDGTLDLPGDSAAYELLIRFACAPGARLRIELGRSPDGEEVTLIDCDPASGSVTVDRERSSTAGDHDRAPHHAELFPGHPLTAELRIWVDGSIVELFGGSHWLTTRIYPTRPDSTGIRLSACGASVRLDVVERWQMGDAFAR